MTTETEIASPALPGLTALFSASAALAACGGGGSDSPPAAIPAPPPTPATLTDGDAARFLAQAAFGVTSAASAAELAAVKTKGYGTWLDEQFAAPRSTPSHYDWMISKGYGDVSFRNSFAGVDNTLWRKALSAPDVLRQRVVMALSEIFVISMAGIPVSWRGMAVATYVDMLEERAFGSFRNLLDGVTLSCGMGAYLNLKGNLKEDPKTGRVPDENYAREVMQLLTIGLVQLNLDGSPVQDSTGKLRDTYTQTDITNLARVFTGWDFDAASATDPAFMNKPMVNNAARFSSGAKKVLTVDIPATADGPAAMKTALDTLASHPNVAPFISRQLIQRLVCSNPSPAYLQRVATVFNSSAGDLKAVIRAILTDTEARTVGTSPGAGKLREPIQRFVQWGRTFGVTSATELWNVGDTSNPATRLGQSPLRSPSVFNFFRPGYVPPNSVLGTNNVTAPEFQLCNESSVAGYLNYMQTAIASGVGEVKPSYTAEIALASDAAALLDRIALLLAANALSAATKATISAAVTTMKADTDATKLNRVQATVLLVMASPDYLVQK